MIVSLLREFRPGERRVLLLPQDAARLCEVCDLQVETGAGSGLGIPDDAYARAGARITPSGEAWETAVCNRPRSMTVLNLTLDVTARGEQQSNN